MPTSDESTNPSVTMSDRVRSLENTMVQFDRDLHNEMIAVRKDMQVVIERHILVLETLANRMQVSLEYQKGNLPIDLVMKLFTFFSILITSLLAAILGIKWLAINSGVL